LHVHGAASGFDPANDAQKRRAAIRKAQ
jgi:hypothetical protein